MAQQLPFKLWGRRSPHWAILILAYNNQNGSTSACNASFNNSGAMALLCTEVNLDKVRLLGRWHSNEMLCYLHIQAFPVVAPLAAQMVCHGY